MTEGASNRPKVTRLVWYPILGLLIGAVAAGLASLYFGWGYSSTAVVLLHESRAETPAGVDLGLGFVPSRIVENNIELIRSAAVLDPVVEQLDLEDLENVRDRFTVVASSQNGDLLEIEAVGSNADEAQELTDAILQSFVDYQRSDEVDRLSSEIAAIETQLDALESELDQADSGSTMAGVLDNRLTELATRLDRQVIAASIADGGVKVIDDGSVPPQPARSAAQDAMFGGFLGLVIGIAISVLLLRWPRPRRHTT